MLAHLKIALWSLWVSWWITACEIAATFLFLVVINGITLGHFLWLLWFNSPQQWIFQVCQYERLVVCGTTLEEATQRGPGLVFVLPFLETATLVDIRVKVFEVWWFRWTVFLSGATNIKIFVFSGEQVPSQQILTTDSVTLTVDAVVYYRLSWSLFKESFS